MTAIQERIEFAVLNRDELRKAYEALCDWADMGCMEDAYCVVSTKKAIRAYYRRERRQEELNPCAVPTNRAYKIHWHIEQRREALNYG